MNDDPHHSNGHHRHSHRKRMARIYLLGICGLFCLSDAILFWYTFSQHNPWRILIGVMFGEFVGTALLIGGIWRRSPWSRYVLIVLRFGVIGIYAMLTLYLTGRPEMGNQQVMTLIWIAVGLMVCGNTWLIRTRRIQYLASQAGSGG